MWMRADRSSVTADGVVRLVKDPHAGADIRVPQGVPLFVLRDAELGRPYVRLNKAEGSGAVLRRESLSIAYPAFQWMVVRNVVQETRTISSNNFTRMAVVVDATGQRVYQRSTATANLAPFAHGRWHVVFAWFRGASSIGPSDFMEVDGVRVSGESAGSDALSTFCDLAYSTSASGKPFDVAEWGVAAGTADIDYRIALMRGYLTDFYQGLTT
jgi:hypothetical protein